MHRNLPLSGSSIALYILFVVTIQHAGLYMWFPYWNELQISAARVEIPEHEKCIISIRVLYTVKLSVTTIENLMEYWP